MTTVTFFAHGTTLDNELGNATGWLPGKLSGRGVHEAKALKQALMEGNFTCIFTSDLARAVNTALLAVGHDIDTRADWRLREANYGRFEGKPKAFKGNMHQFIAKPYPGGESYKQVEKRIASFISDIQTMFPDQNIAIIGHQATQLGLDVVAGGLTWTAAIDQDWRNTGDWQPGWKYIL